MPRQKEKSGPRPKAKPAGRRTHRSRLPAAKARSATPNAHALSPESTPAGPKNARRSDAAAWISLPRIPTFLETLDFFTGVWRLVLSRKTAPSSEDSWRAWIVGSGAGHETHAAAIAFADLSARGHPAATLRIFASDLDAGRLKTAREGLFTERALVGLPAVLRRKFFDEEENRFRVVKTLRESIVFARQNPLSDPPFSRIDLIVCVNAPPREPAFLPRVLPAFHHALNPRGCLVWLASEPTDLLRAWFDPVDPKRQIHVRRPGESPLLPVFAAADGPNGREKRLGLPVDPAGAGRPLREADRLALGWYAPPSVLLNEDLQVVEFRGDTGPYLKAADGRATFDVLAMARAGLGASLRAALARARKTGKPVHSGELRIREGTAVRRIRLRVLRLREEPSFLVFFEERRPAWSAPRSPMSTRSHGKRSGERLRALETELAETRDTLEGLRDQKDSALEELQASHEEVTSAFEETHSVNQELERSNEQLSVLTDRMARHNADLVGLNGDLVNIQNAANFPLLVLGRDLAIRRFNEPARVAFSLDAVDIGRPIGGIRHRLDANLEALVESVTASGRETEREVRNALGHTYSLKVRPYLSPDNKVDGAILVMFDITQLKRVETALRQAGEELEGRVKARTAELNNLNRALQSETAQLKRAKADRDAILQKLLTAQEQERMRISLGLHDEVGQNLAALKLELKLLEDTLRRGDSPAPKIEALNRIAGELLRQTHELAVELRPGTLDNLGLAQALADYLNTWSQRAGIAAELAADGLNDERLPAAIEITIYRIVCEALHNVVKHARATHVSVVLRRREDQVIAIVEDDGVGFDPSAKGKGKRLGLAGMRERASLAGGELTIESGNSGTSVFLALPIGPSPPVSP